MLEWWNGLNVLNDLFRQNIPSFPSAVCSESKVKMYQVLNPRAFLPQKKSIKASHLDTMIWSENFIENLSEVI